MQDNDAIASELHDYREVTTIDESKRGQGFLFSPSDSFRLGLAKVLN